MTPRGAAWQGAARPSHGNMIVVPKARSLFPLIAAGGGILALDQATKVAVVRLLGLGHRLEVIPGLFSLVCNYNTGAAFGLLRGSQGFLAVISVVAMLILPFIIRASLRNGRPSLGSYGLMAVLAGDIGNLVDRLFRDQGVVDFLYFHIGNPEDPLASWFPFNVADSAICIGVALFLLHSYRIPRRDRETEPEGTG